MQSEYCGPMPRDVLVIQHERPEGMGRIEPILSQRGLIPKVVRRDLSESLPRPSDVESLAALVILGGSMGVGDITADSELGVEYAFVQRALAMDIPTLGICLGSQLMARAMGSTSWTGDWELGWQEVSGPIAKTSGFPEEFPALHWHRDRFSPPPGAVNLASTASTPCQAFSNGPHLGLLFHLEADAEQTAAMAEHLPSDLTESHMSLNRLLHDSNRLEPVTDRLADSVFGQWADNIHSEGHHYPTPGLAP